MSLALTFPGSSSLLTRDTSPFLQASNSSRKAPLTALRPPTGPGPPPPLSGLSAGLPPDDRLEEDELLLLSELGAGAGGKVPGDNTAAASPGGGDRGLGMNSPSGWLSGPGLSQAANISGLRGGESGGEARLLGGGGEVDGEGCCPAVTDTCCCSFERLEDTAAISLL